MLDALEGAGATSPPSLRMDPEPQTIDASGLISGATNVRTGQIDTRALAQVVQAAAGRDPATASAAYSDVEHQLGQRSPADASRFNADIRDAFRTAGDAAAGSGVGAVRAGAHASSLGAARTRFGEGLSAKGAQLLRDNPLLSKQWVSTASQWTRRGGFTDGLEQMLSQHGISFNATPRLAPAGSVGRTSGVSSKVANNTNGALARDAIARDLQASGATVTKEVDIPGTGRRVDVRGDFPATSTSPATRVEIESKVGRTGLSSTTRAQAAKDGQALIENRTARSTAERLLKDGEAAAASGGALSNAGRALEIGGGVLKPLAVAADGAQLVQAFRADGDHIGSNTGRTASGVAGSWAGAAAGAELGAEAGAVIGSVVPGAGTVVGGVIGGLVGGAAGAFAGDGIGRKAFDTVRSWF